MRIINEERCNLNVVGHPMREVTTGLKELVQFKGYEKSTYMAYLIESEDNDVYFNACRWFRGDIDASSLSLNYKLNEEIDSANISLIDGGNINSAFVLDFKLPNRTKVVLFYDVEIKNNQVTYSGYDEFVISGGQLVEKTVDGTTWYFHAYQLVEPIYLTKFVEVGSNTLTNIERIKQYDNSGNPLADLTQEPTNCYKALDRILQITYLDGLGCWKDRLYITNEAKAILQSNGIGRNYAFNETTLYDVLFKIASYCDCYPVISFASQVDEFLLDLVNKNGNNVEHSNALDNVTNLSISDMSGKQASQVVTEVQNGVIEESYDFFLDTRNGGLKLQKEDDSLYMSGSDIQSLVFKTFHPISKGDSVTLFMNCEVQNVGLVYIQALMGLVDKQEWSILPAEVQDITAYFNENDNKVYASHIIQKAFWDDNVLNVTSLLKNIRVVKAYNMGGVQISLYDTPYKNGNYSIRSITGRIKYKPYINAKIKVGKFHSYQEAITQNESAVDLNLYNAYLKEYARLNNGLNIQFNKVETSYSNILAVGSYFYYNSKKMIINDVSVNVRNGWYEASYNASVEKPLRSENVGFDSSTENNFIDPTKVQQRLINISDTIHLKLNLEGMIMNEYVEKTATQYDVLKMFKNFFLSGNKLNTNWALARLDDKFIKLPSIQIASGNSMLFNINFPTNRLLYSGGLDGYNSVNGKYIISDLNHSSAIVNYYTDGFGKIDNAQFIFISLVANDINAYKDYNAYNGSNSPSFNSHESSFEYYFNQTSTQSLSLYRKTILKDTNELLNITYQMNFESDDNNVKVHPQFVNAIKDCNNPIFFLYDAFVDDDNFDWDLLNEVCSVTLQFDSSSNNFYIEMPVTYTFTKGITLLAYINGKSYPLVARNLGGNSFTIQESSFIDIIIY